MHVPFWTAPDELDKPPARQKKVKHGQIFKQFEQKMIYNDKNYKEQKSNYLYIFNNGNPYIIHAQDNLYMAGNNAPPTTVWIIQLAWQQSPKSSDHQWDMILAGSRVVTEYRQSNPRLFGPDNKNAEYLIWHTLDARLFDEAHNKWN